MVSRSSKTDNARLQQAIYNKAVRKALQALKEKHPDEFEALKNMYQAFYEVEAGYEPAPRGGRKAAA